MGRSSLLVAVAGKLREAGVDVLIGRAMPPSGGSIYTALYDALLDPASQTLLPPAAHRLLRNVVATPGPGGSADQAFSRGEQVAATFARHGRNRPLLVIADNVDVGEEQARHHLVDLIERLGGARRGEVSILLAPATGTSRGLPALQVVQPSLVTLEPLDDDGVVALVHQKLRAAPDEPFLTRLRQLSADNAATAGWLLDTWQHDGALQYVDNYAFLTELDTEPTLPAWHPRLASLRVLGPRVWLTAVALAVMGPLPVAAAVPRLAALCGLTEDVVAHCVEELTTAQHASKVGGALTMPDELVRTSLASYAGAMTRTRWSATERTRRATPPHTATPLPAAPDLAAAYRRGEWDTVMCHARRLVAGIEVHPRQGSAAQAPPARAEALAALVWVRRGRPDRAREWLARIDVSGDPSSEQRLAETELALLCGESRRARHLVVECLNAKTTSGWAELVAHVLTYAGPGTDPPAESGRHLVDDLWAERSATNMSDHDRLWLMLARSRAAGRSDPTAAIEAMKLARHLGQRYALALSCLAAAELGVEPSSTLGEAFELFDGLGAIPAWCCAAAVARAHRVRVPASRVGPDGYDDVTRLLLALVAEGLSTSVIARVLRLSDASVVARLSRLYARGGYRSRAELAVAFKQGTLTAAWL